LALRRQVFCVGLFELRIGCLGDPRTSCGLNKMLSYERFVISRIT
jgi:hypothetical protein